MPARRKQYTEEDRATALAFLTANKGNLTAAAKATGVPRKTLAYWSKGGAVNAPVAKLRQEKEGALAALWETEARTALEAAGEIRYEASYGQLIMAAGIATDKVLALRKADAPTPEQIAALVSGFEEAVLANVPDADARQKISAAISRLAEGVGPAA